MAFRIGNAFNGINVSQACLHFLDKKREKTPVKILYGVIAETVAIMWCYSVIAVVIATT